MTRSSWQPDLRFKKAWLAAWSLQASGLGSLETAPKRTNPLSPTMSSFTKRILQAFGGCGLCEPRMDPLVMSWGLLASAHQGLAQCQGGSANDAGGWHPRSNAPKEQDNERTPLVMARSIKASAAGGRRCND